MLECVQWVLIPQLIKNVRNHLYPTYARNPAPSHNLGLSVDDGVCTAVRTRSLERSLFWTLLVGACRSAPFPSPREAKGERTSVRDLTIKVYRTFLLSHFSTSLISTITSYEPWPIHHDQQVTCWRVRMIESDQSEFDLLEHINALPGTHPSSLFRNESSSHPEFKRAPQRHVCKILCVLISNSSIWFLHPLQDWSALPWNLSQHSFIWILPPSSLSIFSESAQIYFLCVYNSWIQQGMAQDKTCGI